MAAYSLINQHVMAYWDRSSTSSLKKDIIFVLITCNLNEKPLIGADDRDLQRLFSER